MKCFDCNREVISGNKQRKKIVNVYGEKKTIDVFVCQTCQQKNKAREHTKTGKIKLIPNW